MWNSLFEERPTVVATEKVDYRNDQTAFIAELAELNSEICTNEDLDHSTFLQTLDTLWKTRYDRLHEEYEFGQYIHDSKMHELLLQSTLAEKQIWSLFDRLHIVERYISENADANADLADFSQTLDLSSEVLNSQVLETRLIGTNPKFLHMYSILEWLEATYVNPSDKTQLPSLLYHTTNTNFTQMRNSNSGDQWYSLDPDTVLRGKCKDLMDSRELQEETAFLAAVYHYLRQGVDISKVVQVCKDSLAAWRVPTLYGNTAYSIIDTTSNSNGTDNGYTTGIRPSLLPEYFSALSTLAATTGNSVESAIYSILCGQPNTHALNLAETWKDQLWVKLKAKYIVDSARVYYDTYTSRFQTNDTLEYLSDDIMDTLMCCTSGSTSASNMYSECKSAIQELKQNSIFKMMEIPATIYTSTHALPPSFSFEDILTELQHTSISTSTGTKTSLSSLSSSTRKVTPPGVQVSSASDLVSILANHTKCIVECVLLKNIKNIPLELMKTYTQMRTLTQNMAKTPFIVILMRQFITFALQVIIYIHLFVNPNQNQHGDHIHDSISSSSSSTTTTTSTSLVIYEDAYAYFIREYIQSIKHIPSLHHSIPKYVQYAPKPVMIDILTQFVQGFTKSDIADLLQSYQQYPLIVQHYSDLSQSIASAIITHTAPKSYTPGTATSSTSSTGTGAGAGSTSTPMSTPGSAKNKSFSAAGLADILDAMDDDNDDDDGHEDMHTGGMDDGDGDDDDGFLSIGGVQASIISTSTSTSTSVQEGKGKNVQKTSTSNKSVMVLHTPRQKRTTQELFSFFAPSPAKSLKSSTSTGKDDMKPQVLSFRTPLKTGRNTSSTTDNTTDNTTNTSTSINVENFHTLLASYHTWINTLITTCSPDSSKPGYYIPVDAAQCKQIIPDAHITQLESVRYLYMDSLENETAITADVDRISKALLMTNALSRGYILSESICSAYALMQESSLLSSVVQHDLLKYLEYLRSPETFNAAYAELDTEQEQDTLITCTEVLGNAMREMEQYNVYLSLMATFQRFVETVQEKPEPALFFDEFDFSIANTDHTSVHAAWMHTMQSLAMQLFEYVRYLYTVPGGYLDVITVQDSLQNFEPQHLQELTQLRTNIITQCCMITLYTCSTMLSVSDRDQDVEQYIMIARSFATLLGCADCTTPLDTYLSQECLQIISYMFIQLEILYSSKLKQ